MPRKPSFAISATASAGNLPVRSRSAAKGRSRSAAKLRAVSRMSACSALGIIWVLPRQLDTFEIEEPAAVCGLESRDYAAHSGNAFFRRDRRAGPAHVRPDPARMQNHRDHLAKIERKRV